MSIIGYIKGAQVSAGENAVLENLRRNGLISPAINTTKELLGRCLSVIQTIEGECTTEQEGLDALASDIKSAISKL